MSVEQREVIDPTTGDLIPWRASQSDIASCDWLQYRGFNEDIDLDGPSLAEIDAAALERLASLVVEHGF